MFVTTSTGSPLADADVFITPRHGNPSLYRRAKFDAASRHYLIEGVVPGEYILLAWDSSPDDAEYNAAFLKESEERGIRVTVRPRETTRLSLPLTTAER